MQNFTDVIKKHKVQMYYAVTLIGFLMLMTLFASLADNVHEGDTLMFDNAVLTWIRDTVSSPGLDAFMSVATDVGGTIVVAVATVVIAGVLLYMRRYRQVLFTVAVMVGVALAVSWLKVIFGRERPDVVERITMEDTFSFPSGHAMGSAGLAILIGILAWRTKWRWPLIITAVAYVLFVGFSRLYLNVHYPTDVLAGWLLATGWVVAVYLVFRSSKRLRI